MTEETTKTIRLTTENGFHKDIRSLEVGELTEYAKGFQHGRSIAQTLTGYTPLAAFNEGRKFTKLSQAYNLGFEDALENPVGILEVI